MNSSTVDNWYTAALIQVAAEAYVRPQSVGASANAARELAIDLERGNNREEMTVPNGLLQMPRSTEPAAAAGIALQANKFANDWQVVYQADNDNGGFSATLLRRRGSGNPEYTIAFRSTEYRSEANGGDWQRDVMNADIEIKDSGFAFGQIRSMRRWWANLIDGRDAGGAVDANLTEFKSHIAGAGNTVDVVGYSLGGNLATVFTELESAKVGKSTIFNAPGRGQLGVGTVAQMLARFDAILANPAILAGSSDATTVAKYQSWQQRIASETATVDGKTITANGAPLPFIYEHPRYKLALEVVRHEFAPVAPSSPGVPGLPGEVAGKLTQIFGHATHNDVEIVANVGVRASAPRFVFIEDQPNVVGALGPLPGLPFTAGWNGDFGTTHSLVLIIDSLAIMRLLQKVDPSLANDSNALTNLAPNANLLKMHAILAAASHQRGMGLLGTQGTAESDSLEKVLDALRRAYANPGTQVEPTEAGPGSRGFGNIANRTEFYTNLATLEDLVTQKGSGTLVNVVPETLFSGAREGVPNGEPVNTLNPSNDLVSVANLKQKALLTDAEGRAYRYALQQMNPFVLLHPTLYQNRTDLDLYDPQTRQGVMTDAYIEDRAKLLTRTLYYAVNNGPMNLATDPPTAIEGSGRYDGLDAVKYDAEDIIWESREQEVVIRRGSTTTAATKYVTFGGENAEVLIGGNAADRLYGDAGNDILQGRGGSDYLEGGVGTDVYQYAAGDGSDTVLDVDGKGVLRYLWGGTQSQILGDAGIKVSDTRWTSSDGRIVYDKVAAQDAQGQTMAGRFDLLVDLSGALGGSAGAAVRVSNFDFGVGQTTAWLGVKLGATATVANFSNVNQISVANGNGGSSYYGTVAGTDRIDGTDADDLIWAPPNPAGSNQVWAADYVLGQVGSDWIVTGDGADRIDTGTGKGDQSVWSDSARGDRVYAGGGDDRVYGDPVTAGEVVSLAAVIVQGDAVAGGQPPAGLAGRGDALSGGAGADIIVGTSARDLLSGGPGGDTVVAGAGDDWIFADIDLAPGIASWSVTPATGVTWSYDQNEINEAVRASLGVAMPADYAGPVLANFGTITAAEVMDHDLGGGADTVYAGAGNDVVWAGRGNDFIDGGSGNDVIVSSAGDDVVNGGDGNDWVMGDYADANLDRQGNDVLDGGAGNDYLFGLGGDDIIFGGAGNDWLEGNKGDDIMVGGDGVDTIYGGSGRDTILSGTGANETLYGGFGKDTYVFNRGDGVKWISDPDDIEGTFSAQTANLNPDKSIIVLNGVNRNQIKFRKGSLLLDLQDGDAIHLTGFVSGPNNDPSDRKLFDRLEFGDGSVMTFEDMRAQGYDLDGTEGNDTLYGTTIKDRILGLGGNDTIHGLAGDDVLEGGAGNDTLWGSEGHDVLRGGAGDDFLQGEAGNDSLEGGAGNDVLGGGEGDNSLDGGDGNDSLGSGAGVDVLVGGAGNDILFGGSGDDTLLGGTGTDTYYLLRGGGRDVIEEVVGEISTLRLAGDSAPTLADLTLLRDGDDLILGIRNTTDSLVLKSAFVGNALSDWRIADSYGNGLAVMSSFVSANLPAPIYASTTEAAADFEARQRSRLGDEMLLAGATLGGDGKYTKVLSSVAYRAGFASITEAVNNAASFSQSTANSTYAASTTTTTINFVNVSGGAGNNTIRVTGGAMVDGGSGDDVIRADLPLAPLPPWPAWGGATTADALLSGGGGNDTLYGGMGADLLIGGTGTNLLEGGLGADRYIVLGGGDDTIIESNQSFGDSVDLPKAVRFADLQIAWDAPEWRVTTRPASISGALYGINGYMGFYQPAALNVATGVLRINWGTVAGGGSVRIIMNRSDDPAGSGVTSLRLGDGTVLTRDGLAQIAGAGFDPNAAANVSTSLAQVAGEGGNDALSWNGSTGAWLRGGAGADTVSGGAGNDFLTGDGGSDVLDGGAGNDLIGAGIEEYYGPANVYRGGTGDDTLLGSKGADVFLYRRGDGADIVGDWLHDPSFFDGWWLGGGDNRTGYQSADILRLEADGANTITPDQLTLSLASTVAVRSDKPDLLISFGGSDSVRFVNWETLPFQYYDPDGGWYTNPGTPAQIGRIEFADGTVWTLDTIRSALNSTLSGNTGNDTLNAPNGGGFLRGLAGNDTLNGSAGRDYLDGGAGNDIMTGGANDDTYVVESTADVVSEAANGGTDTIQASVTWSLATLPEVENLTLTGTAAINATGNAKSNLIIGNAGTLNLIDGGAGADTLRGGLGRDEYWVDNVGDVVEEGADNGLQASGTPYADFIYTSVNYTMPANVEVMHAMNGSGATLTGNDGDNILGLSNDAAANSAYGGAGNDIYHIQTNDQVFEYAGGGYDRITVWNHYALSDAADKHFEHLVIGGLGNFNGTGNALDNLIEGDASNNVLWGLAGNDSLVGGAGNDVLIGDSGVDLMTGGAGDDAYVVDNVNDQVIESAGEGNDYIDAYVNYTIAANVETLIMYAGANGTGDARDNGLYGHSDPAVNTLYGGAGNDFYSITGNDIIVEEAEGGSWDVVYSHGDKTIDANVEAMVMFFGSTGTGNAGDNHLHGNLDAGVNRLIGLGGNDAYHVGAGDIVEENASGGAWDAVYAYGDYTIPYHVEAMVMQVGAAGTGNDGVNVLIGHVDPAANRLEGRGGNDEYDVGANDTVVESANGGAWDHVNAFGNFTIPDHVEALRMFNGATGTGNAANNHLQGFYDPAANRLIGQGGDDWYMIGANDIVEEQTGGGAWDVIEAWGDHIMELNVEAMTMRNGAAGTGNAQANHLHGDGDAAVNTLIGLGGDDYYVINGNDIVVEEVDGGTYDVVQAHTDYVLHANVEVLTMRYGATGTGNGQVNRLHGDQDAAVNTLIGKGGDDMYHVGVGDLVVEETDGGWDHVYTNHTRTIDHEVEGLSVTSSGANAFGDSRVNYLTGHLDAASNTLTGFGGNDVYEVGANDLVVEAANGGTWDHVNAYGNYIIPDNVEALRLFNGATGTGNAADNHLQGHEATSGSNLLSGQGGNDHYLVGRGGGSDTIDETTSGSGYDSIEFYSGVAKNQIWFRQVGQDLEASILGTSDKATVKDWFAISQRPVEQFVTTDGWKTSTAAQVDLLVQAMAGIVPSGSATNHAEVSMSQAQRDNLNTVFASAWT